nr:zinc finger, PMZ-type [Tanacetum cinerariifolium]
MNFLLLIHMRSTINTDTFKVNLWHDGIFLVNPFTYSSGDFRVINDVNFETMTYSNFFAIIRRLVLVLPVKIFYKTRGMPLTSFKELATYDDVVAFVKDGLVLVLPVKMFYKTRGMPLTSFKELATYDDVVAFVKDGYDHGNEVELYTEHSGYNVLEMINNEDANVYKSSSDLDSSDDDYDPLDDLTDLINFQTKGDDNLDIPKITTDDPWLNKLVGKGNFIGYTENPKPLDGSKLLVKCGRDVSKGKYARMKGKLLTAMGRDANNQMFPIAWAVVSVENKNNWSTINTDTFKVNLWHDGIFLVNPFTYSSCDFRVINDVNFETMTYSNFFAIIRRLVLVLPVKIFYKTRGMPLTSFKELATYDDVVAFVKDGYDHGNEVELYTEHSSYNVLEMINNEDANVYKSSSDLDSYDDDYDPLDDLTDLIDFQTEGDDNLDIPKITTDDHWLKKLVGKGNFIGYTENPKPLDGMYILERMTQMSI